MANSFFIGDTVRLKVGGPNMLIDAKTSIGFRCVWFFEGTSCSEIYSATSLQMVEKG